MKGLSAAGAALAGLVMLGAGSVASAATLTPVGFTGNGNIQSNLLSEGPSGDFTTANSFATPFSIPATGNNFAAVTASDPLAITGLAISNATDVFTIMNAYAPESGAVIGAITFDFTDGTSELNPLVAGSNIRDYYQGGFANTITASNAQNAFTYTNVQGGLTPAK